MKFEDVLPALRKGKKVRRNFWRKDTYFYKDHQGIFIFKNGGYEAYHYNLSCLLDSDDWEIIQEPRKVKLRDLTLEEWEKRKEKYCADMSCSKCMFDIVNCSERGWISHKDLYSDKFLDQEIEIEEE